MAVTTTGKILTLELFTCSERGCGMTYGVPHDWVTARRDDHVSWYCLNGHSQYFPGQSDKEKLREQVAALSGNLKHQTERNKRLNEENTRLERSRRAVRGQKTRIVNRLKEGLCPWCGQDFPDLGAHVLTHGDQVHAEETEPA